MIVQQEENGLKGFFYINMENKPLAIMHYIYSGMDTLIIPLCLYAKRIFNKTPDYQDVYFNN